MIEPGRSTFDGLEDDAGVIVGDDVGVAVFGLVYFQVGVLPRELLAWIDGLVGRSGRGQGVRGWVCRGSGGHCSPRTPGRA